MSAITRLTRRQIMAVTMMSAVAAVAGSIVTAEPAHAASGNYIALSYSTVDQSWGWGRHTDANTAVARSLYECSQYGDQCVYVAIEKDYCVAVAAFQDKFALGRGRTANDAGQMAAHGLARSRILYSGCA